jgi:hypothetical protein
VRLGELLAIPVGLFVVKQITDRIDKEPSAPIPDKPLIKNGFETGPAGPDIKDFNLLPEIKVTEEQLAAFDPSRPAEIKPYNPGALVAQPISGGGPFRLDFGGRSLADILQGRR